MIIGTLSQIIYKIGTDLQQLQYDLVIDVKIQPVESIFFLLIYEFCILFLVKLREILKINYIKLIANKP